MIKFISCILTFAFSFVIFSAAAHQPVMDMAPRWEEGYGFQIRHESYGSNKLMKGDSEIANNANDKFSVNTNWFEAVYTFDKSKRITFKLPYVKKTKTTDSITKTKEGFGDLILAMPLKQYHNQKGFTYNFGLTPQIRLPTGDDSGDLAISDGSTDLGLSFSYSSETPTFYQLYDIFYWVNNKGSRGMNDGNELGLDINLGYHNIHRNETNAGMFLIWDLSARKKQQGHTLNNQINGSSLIQTGPVLVLYKDNIMFRGEYKLPIYESFKNTGFSRGKEINIIIGLTY